MPDDAQEMPVRQPVLRVVRGEPTLTELAAVVTAFGVLAARAAQNARQVQGARSGWADRRSLLRPPVHPGTGGWRSSARPT